MPNDRLLRYSIAGASFIFFFFFFQYLFGRDLASISNIILDEKNFFFTIIGLILSTPVLGIMVSTLIFQFQYWTWRGMNVYFTKPENKEIVGWILDGYNDSENVKSKKGKEYLKAFFPYYQIKVRKHVTTESLPYLERKLSVYYVHMNIIGSIILSLFLGIGYPIYSYLVNGISFERDYNAFKITASGFLILYMVAAIQIARAALKDATTFEHLMLENAFKLDKEKKKKKSSNPIATILTTLIEEIFK